MTVKSTKKNTKRRRKNVNVSQNCKWSSSLMITFMIWVVSAAVSPYYHTAALKALKATITNISYPHSRWLRSKKSPGIVGKKHVKSNESIFICMKNCAVCWFIPIGTAGIQYAKSGNKSVCQFPYLLMMKEILGNIPGSVVVHMFSSCTCGFLVILNRL